MTLILGIETSCDETAAAVVEDGVRVRSNVIASQHDLHETYLGVVPEIASRAHLERISPVIQESLTAAGVTFGQIDAVAVGNRPGLIGSLLVGVSAAKALAWALGKPLIGIDHVQAHLYAAFLAENRREEDAETRRRGDAGTEDGNDAETRGHGDAEKDSVPASPRPGVPASLPSPIPASPRPGVPASLPSPIPASPRPRVPASFPSSVPASLPPPYPALGLVVSGGHTSLYEVESPLVMRVIGRTIDDAVGEAYDKAAVILQLGYPGGPRLDQLAQTGRADAFAFPRSMLERDSLDFSFSGLKTALLYAVRGHPVGRGENAVFERSADDLTDTQRADLAASFQAAAIGALMTKLDRALDHVAARNTPAQSLLVGGGVSANSLLRRRLAELGKQRSLPVGLPAMPYCLDNAAMIAGLAHHHLVAGERDGLDLPALATTSII